MGGIIYGPLYWRNEAGDDAGNSDFSGSSYTCIHQAASISTKCESFGERKLSSYGDGTGEGGGPTYGCGTHRGMGM